MEENKKQPERGSHEWIVQISDEILLKHLNGLTAAQAIWVLKMTESRVTTLSTVFYDPKQSLKA